MYTRDEMPEPKGTSMTTILVIVMLVLAAIWGIIIYNKLAKLNEQTLVTWTPLYGVLQQRYDEVPKLVNEVILYTAHEDEETKALSEAQKAFSKAESVSDKVKTANDVETALERMLLQAGQRYPGIESHFQFIELNRGFAASQAALAGPQVAFNIAVDKFNSYSIEFPHDIIAKYFGFEGEKPYFKKERGSEQPEPAVQP